MSTETLEGWVHWEGTKTSHYLDPYSYSGGVLCGWIGRDWLPAPTDKPKCKVCVRAYEARCWCKVCVRAYEARCR